MLAKRSCAKTQAPAWVSAPNMISPTKHKKPLIRVDTTSRAFLKPMAKRREDTVYGQAERYIFFK
jgi:hypothetical protein